MTKEQEETTATTEQEETAPVVQKKKRVHKSGYVAARNVRKQSKSSAPIFFEKTMSHMVNEHAPNKTRISPGAKRLLRAVLEYNAVQVAKKAYAITRSRNRKSKKARATARDVDLVLNSSI